MFGAGHKYHLSLWSKKRGPLHYTLPISAATAATLEQLWSTMLMQAQQPAESVRCIDATSYYVFEWSGGVRSAGGCCRCPQEGTPPGAALVVLGELRKATEESKTGLWRQETRLAKEVAGILRSLK
jgi:hypothetical protein